MGSSNWNAQSYRSYSQTVSTKSQQQIFTNTTGCHPDLNPSKFSIRESVDSPANPKSTPVIIGVDETGSMGYLATDIIKKGLGIIIEGIIDRKPIKDPHILLAGIGDAYIDDAPIQVTQFEADTVITQQIEKLFIEGNGGGNGGESYSLIWWFALNKTRCDAINLRNRKGYLFTIGDESCHPQITKEQIKHFFDCDVEKDVSSAELLAECQEKWEVFHIVTPTTTTSHQNAIDKWRELLGERAIVIEDWHKLSEVIVSVMQVNEGQDVNQVIKSWDGDTNLVVASAVTGLSKPNQQTEIEEI